VEPNVELCFKGLKTKAKSHFSEGITEPISSREPHTCKDLC